MLILETHKNVITEDHAQEVTCIVNRYCPLLALVSSSAQPTNPTQDASQPAVRELGAPKTTVSTPKSRSPSRNRPTDSDTSQRRKRVTSPQKIVLRSKSMESQYRRPKTKAKSHDFVTASKRTSMLSYMDWYSAADLQ